MRREMFILILVVGKRLLASCEWQQQNEFYQLAG